MNPKFVPVLPGKELPPETPLWRYMELDRFFMLLSGFVFIPSLATLRKASDPKEASLPKDSVDDLAAWLLTAEDRQWFQQHPSGRPDADAFDEYLWHLGNRRLVWCWSSPQEQKDIGSPESMAMWNSYAKNGVALRITFQSLKGAIRASEALKDLQYEAVPVAYHPQGWHIQKLVVNDQVPRPFRPFAYKEWSYAYEKEIRIAFQVPFLDPLRGYYADIEPKELLRNGQVVFSPYLDEIEARALERIVKRLLGQDTKVRHSTLRLEGPYVLPEVVKDYPHRQSISHQQLGENGDLPPLLDEL